MEDDGSGGRTAGGGGGGGGGSDARYSWAAGDCQGPTASGGGASTTTALASNIFWSEASFAPIVARGERLERTAQLEVFGYGQ